MKSELRIFIAFFIFVISFFIFKRIEFNLLDQGINTIFQALVFSGTLVISIFLPQFRIKLMYAVFVLMFAVALFYLMNQLVLSNSLASIAIGVLLLILFSYLPVLIKKGHVEKL